jgi:hypothetical protein
MPNWCNNWTHFRHTDRTQAERLVAAFEKKWLFDEFHPCPLELRNIDSPNRDEGQVAALIEKYGYADWYSWCVNNWGTKWDTEAYDIPEIVEDGDEFVVSVSFDTAWSPPVPFYHYMAEQGWNITGYYVEWGMNFCGVWDDGVDESYEIPETAEEAERELPPDLEEVFDICQTLADREEEYEDEEN